MKFHLDRGVLADAVSWATRTLPVRPAMPILQGVRIVADASGELQLQALSDEDVMELRVLLERHAELTDSAVARRLLDAADWSRFTRLVPRDWAAVHAIRDRAEHEGNDPDSEQVWEKIKEVTRG